MIICLKSLQYLMALKTERVKQYNNNCQYMLDQTLSEGLKSYATLPTSQKSGINRNARLDIRKMSIKIRNHHLYYAHVSPDLKEMLMKVFKHCEARQCLEQAFDLECIDTESKKHSQTIQIKDVDATNLIIKMLRSLQKLKTQKKIIKIKQIITDKSNDSKQLQIFKDTLTKTKKQLCIHASSGSQNLILKKNNLQELQKLFEQAAVKIDHISKSKQYLQEKLIQYQKRLDYFKPSTLIGDCLEKTISKMCRNLLKQSILMIIQTSKEIELDSSIPTAYIVFQQSFHTIKVLQSEITKIIGTKAYFEKIRAFENLVQGQNQNKLVQYSDMMSCHRCMSLFQSKDLKFCDKKISNKQTNPFQSTDSYVYRQNMINCNYSNPLNNSLILPYFKYSQNESDKLTCNRAYCKQCLINIYRMDYDQFQCPYCTGICNCPRCNAAYSLVKLISYDIQYDPHQLKKYNTIIKLFNSYDSSCTLQRLPIRKADHFQQFSQLKQIYELSGKRLDFRIVIPKISKNNSTETQKKQVHRYQLTHKNSFLNIQQSSISQSKPHQQQIQEIIHEPATINIISNFEIDIDACLSLQGLPNLSIQNLHFQF